jgi:succinoglycan biosynthesis protein ExoO
LDGSFADIEIVVCNDASTDSTARSVEDIDDPRINLIHNAANIGEGASRDRAIEVAKGQWIALLDADDLYTKDRLSVLMRVAQARPNAIVFDDLMECHDTPAGIRPWQAVSRGISNKAKTANTRRVKFQEWISWRRTIIQPVIPTRFIREHGLKHSHKLFSADLEFFLAVIARTQPELWYVPQPMYQYRLTAGSMSSVPDRYALLRTTFEEALPLYADDPDAVMAIQRRIALAHRSEEYQAFFSALMQGKLGTACNVAWTKPWVVPEFAHRLAARIPYHLSRLRHGAARRKTI